MEDDPNIIPQLSNSGQSASNECSNNVDEEMQHTPDQNTQEVPVEKSDEE